MFRFPGNRYLDSTYAAIAPNSIVSGTEITTTMTLFKKYCPMFAAVHARAKFSNLATDGRPHGLTRNSLFVLNDDTIAHSSGSVVSRPQTSRNVPFSRFSAPVPAPTPGALRRGAGAAVAGLSTVVVMPPSRKLRS